ncbi:MAG: hypothetical protein E7315_06610 [Clostridiales bacterium]|nr:hypothetical protein [Clostridiales bacterium]
MKISVKKIVCSLLLAAICFSMCACGGWREYPQKNSDVNVLYVSDAEGFVPDNIASASSVGNVSLLSEYTDETDSIWVDSSSIAIEDYRRLSRIISSFCKDGTSKSVIIKTDKSKSELYDIMGIGASFDESISGDYVSVGVLFTMIDGEIASVGLLSRPEYTDADVANLFAYASTVEYDKAYQGRNFETETAKTVLLKNVFNTVDMGGVYLTNFFSLLDYDNNPTIKKVNGELSVEFAYTAYSYNMIKGTGLMTSGMSVNLKTENDGLIDYLPEYISVYKSMNRSQNFMFKRYFDLITFFEGKAIIEDNSKGYGMSNARWTMFENDKNKEAVYSRDVRDFTCVADFINTTGRYTIDCNVELTALGEAGEEKLAFSVSLDEYSLAWDKVE